MSTDARSAKVIAGVIAATAGLLVFAATASAATITVDTVADQYNTDPAHCSLREAIKSVDGTSGSDLTGTDFGGCVASGGYATSAGPPDTIMVPAGTYQLTLSAAADDSDASGDLDVFRSMNIVGTGNPTIEQTVAGERVMDETATGKVLSISGLTISGGDQASSDGGGIHYVGGAGAAHLTLDGVTVTGNQTAGNGGGIFTDSASTITNSVISDNHTVVASGLKGNGGGIYSDGSTDSLSGVSLSVDHSSITGNFAGDSTNFGYGGGIYRTTKASDSTSSGVIQDSDISGNTAHFFGGGIYTQSDSTLDVERSLISGNHALVLRGGGIAADSQTSAVGQLNLVNSTITGNSSNADGGGIKAGGISGTINLNLLFTTIAENTGSSGSELSLSGNSSTKPTLAVEGTVFAASNPALMNACQIDGTDYVNTTDGGYNLSTDPTDPVDALLPSSGCGLSSPLPAGDRTGLAAPVLNALADNGGPTETMEPTALSLAVDNMPNSVCAAVNPATTSDQRAFARPEVSGGNCDSGAFEVQPPALNPVGDKAVQAGQPLIFTTSASDPDPGDTLTYSASNIPAGASFNPSSGTFSWTPAAPQTGTYPNVHFSVSDGFSSDAEDVTITVTAPPPAGGGGPGTGGPGTTPAPPAKKKCKKKKKHRAAAAKKCKKRKKKK